MVITRNDCVYLGPARIVMVSCVAPVWFKSEFPACDRSRFEVSQCILAIGYICILHTRTAGRGVARRMVIGNTITARNGLLRIIDRTELLHCKLFNITLIHEEDLFIKTSIINFFEINLR